MDTARKITGATAVATLIALPWAMHGALVSGRGADVVSWIACGQVAVAGLVVLARLAVWLRVTLAAALVGAAALAESATGSIVAASAIDHSLIYGSLIAVFASSLREGRIDLVTGLATRLRGPLAPVVARYTRRVTWAWLLFFAADLLISLLLFTLAPVSTWSLFVNVLDLPLVGLMFGLEYAVRRLVLRGHAHVPIGHAVRAFRRQQTAEAEATEMGGAG